MKQLFDKISEKTSKAVTKTYSTSFSLGTHFLARRFQNPVYAIYGFVRFADEIVDSFHGYNKEELLKEFREDTFKAIERKISLNPVLNNFQETFHQYNIEVWMVDTFLKSMEMDLHKTAYANMEYKQYILGSAEVVGLMCLKVFTERDEALYEELKESAMKLGSAFQKINFLRDFKDDTDVLGRNYFPQLCDRAFTEDVKKEIEADTLKDFKEAYEGIKRLPKHARFGVYIAYKYYSNLLNKIINMPPQKVMSQRIRIPDQEKYALFLGSYLRHSFNLL